VVSRFAADRRRYTSPARRRGSPRSAVAAVTRRAGILEPDASVRVDGESMKFAGTVDIGAPRDKVWAFVVDPDQVGQCGPGVESIEVIDDTHFKATAKVGIGFISARFVVNMEMAEQNPPDRAVIKAHGQAPGSAVDATAEMTLSDGTAGGTRMDWNADVAISGSLASLGSRLIEGTANKMIGQTFDCMKAKLEA
jgi:carbon monoxide dehydrogenase subunit G